MPGSWSVSRNTYPATWSIGVVAANSSDSDAVVEPSDPPRTVVTSTEPTASPAGSVMMGISAPPGPAAVTSGIPEGTAWRAHVGARWTTTLGVGSGGGTVPRSRSFASQVVGAVPALARSMTAVVVAPYSTVAETASGVTAARPPRSTASTETSPPSVIGTG